MAETHRAFKGDTAHIPVTLYDEDEMTPLIASTVTYRVKDPSGTVSTIGPTTINSANFDLAYLTTDPGLYRFQISFTLANGEIKSLLETLEVIDPFEENAAAATVANQIIDHAWMKMEDLFDSELGGPWLQDKTFKSFNRDKLGRFLMDALYYINNEYQPTTTFTTTDWPVEHVPLAAQALMLEGIYHLVRSYVEQPLPAGGQISYFDRRDYMARWQSVLQAEEQKLLRLLDVFKIQYTGFGATSILVGGYATPITRLSKFWRTRYPRYIGPWGF